MVYVFLAEGFEEIEALAVVDILRRAEVPVSTVSIKEKTMIKGAHNITVMTDMVLEDIDSSKIDALILPGGMPGTLHLSKDSRLKQLILDSNKKGILIGAICAAPSILGESNMLIGKDAVCFPGFEEQLLGANVLYDKVVVSDNIVTSRGAGTAMDFGFKLVELLKDKQTSDNLREKMIAD